MHLAVIDRTKEEALDRLRHRRSNLQTELKTLNEFLTLAQACTEYHSYTDVDEDCDVELIDDTRGTAADPRLLHVVEDLLARGLFVASFGDDRRPLATDDDTTPVFPLPLPSSEAVAITAFDSGQFQETGIDPPGLAVRSRRPPATQK